MSEIILHGGKKETYEEFVNKFKPKKTTDDCYTPAEVMEVVNKYVENYYNLDRKTFIRPFYPGGDYENEDYTGKVVVDNPPFSILRKIINFYNENNIKFFLFAPGLTNLYNDSHNTHIVIRQAITYENGAKVSTGFITNMEDGICVRSAVDLDKELKKLYPSKKHQKLELPSNWYNPSRLQNLEHFEKGFCYKWSDVVVHTKYNNKTIFGRAIEVVKNE